MNGMAFKINGGFYVQDSNFNESDNSNDKEEKEEKNQEPQDEKVDLHQQLKEEQAKAAEYLDGWQRARAELANARKRWERESAQTYSNAVVDVVSKLLPAVDDFERAIEIMPDGLKEQTWADGVLLIYRKLQTILEQQGVTPIETKAGMPFDPTWHQAITHEPDETLKEGTIIAEIQKGYKLKERIVRPALVRVSAGPAADDSKNSQEAE